MLTVVNADGSTPNGFLLDESVREGAMRMLAAALETEVNTYLADLANERDERGRRLVARNGYHQPRQVATSVGAIDVKAPRINDRRTDEVTGERNRWRAVSAPHLVALVRAGAHFERGLLVERDELQAA